MSGPSSPSGFKREWANESIDTREEQDPYSFLVSPTSKICTPQYHAKGRKNCTKNPFCVYGMGDAYKLGIYKNPPPVLEELGPDPGALVRQPVTKKSIELCPVGLKNLGATCYLNVLIQSLFQNVLVRDAVLNFVPSSEDSSKKTVMDDVMEALQGAFSHMLLSRQNVYDLSHFTHLLGLDHGEQQDPQEFNKLFMGKLEGSKMKVLLEGRRSLARLLEGREVYITKCSACNAESRRTQPFRELELKIQGLKSVEAALQDYFASEDLTGDSMYFCSKCNQKRDATRRVEMEEAPPVLTIMLKRYSYDLKTYSKIKLKSNVRFEETIRAGGTAGGDSDSDSEPYRLVSVLYHKGKSAYGGHYVTETLDWASGQWWHCDDASIIRCASPVKDLPPPTETGNGTGNGNGNGGKEVEVVDMCDESPKRCTVCPPQKAAKGKAKGSSSPKRGGNVTGRAAAARKGSAKRKRGEKDDWDADDNDDDQAGDGSDDAEADHDGDGETVDAESNVAEASSSSSSSSSPSSSPKKGKTAPMGGAKSKAGAAVARKGTGKGKGASSSSSSSSSKKGKDAISLDRAKDAYCLSYVKESVFQESLALGRVPPSQAAAQQVAASDETFLQGVAAYQARRLALEAQIEGRKELYRGLERDLAPASPADPFHLVPTSWLQQWVSGQKNSSSSNIRPPEAACSSGSGAGSGSGTPLVVDLALDGAQEQGKEEGPMVIDLDGNENEPPQDAAAAADQLPAALPSLLPAPSVFAEKVENLPYRCPHSASTVTINPSDDNTGNDNGNGNGISPSCCFPSIPALQTQLKAVSEGAYRAMVQGATGTGTDVDFNWTNFRCMDCSRDHASENQGIQALWQDYAGILERVNADIASRLGSTSTSDNNEATGDSMEEEEEEEEEEASSSAKSGAKKTVPAPPDLYVIPSKWHTALKNETKALLAGKKGSIDRTVTGELRCPHGLRDPQAAKKKVVYLSAPTWRAVVGVFPAAVALEGGSVECPQCVSAASAFHDTQDQVKSIRVREMDKSTDLRMLALAAPLPYPEEFDDKVAVLMPSSAAAFKDRQAFFVVEEAWMAAWRAFHVDKQQATTLSARPAPITNSSLRCEHGLCLLSDRLCGISEGMCPGEGITVGALGDGLPSPTLVTEKQWASLLQFYGPEAAAKQAQEQKEGVEVVVAENDSSSSSKDPFTISVAADEDGKFQWSPEPCGPCMEKRRQKHVAENSSYSDREVTVRVLAPGEPVPNRVIEVSGSVEDKADNKEGGDGGNGEDRDKGEKEEEEEEEVVVRRASKRRRKGQTLHITVSSNDTLMLAMLKISERLLANQEGRQTVYRRGVELVGKDKTLEQLGVRSGDVLHVQVEDEKETGYDLGSADYGHSRVESGFRGSFLSGGGASQPKADDPGLLDLRKTCEGMGLVFKDHQLAGAFQNAKGNIEVALSILTS